MTKEFLLLRDEFVKEAKTAPKLFCDLAKVEQYIAESYKTRALIELLQNADDAKATKFGLHEINNGFIIGNNGKEFTINDIESLCRSGSSNKKRGGDTIGYRGIGFKSVANLAENVSVISGDFCYSFDKLLTKKLIAVDFDVPLIRIPHPSEHNSFFNLFDLDHYLKTFKYKTLFIFQNFDKRISNDDFRGFDSSSLLFLRNIDSVLIEFSEINRKIFLERTTKNEHVIIEILDNSEKSTWELFYSEKNPYDCVAFKKNLDTIIPTEPEESLIHSFTPTNENIGILFKINGDYTTDPSRKNIDFDEASQKSFLEAAKIISREVFDILMGKISRPGFFIPFTSNQTKENKIKLQFVKILRSCLFNAKNQTLDFNDLRLRPNWLDYDEYEKLCIDDITAIPKKIVTIYPEINTFLKLMNVKELSINEIIQKINLSEISTIGAAQIFTKIIKQYRYDLTAENVENLKQLKIFPKGKILLNTSEIESFSDINSDFIDYTNENIDPSDFSLFLKKLGISRECEKPSVHLEIEVSVQQGLKGCNLGSQNVGNFNTPSPGNIESPGIIINSSLENMAITSIDNKSHAVACHGLDGQINDLDFKFPPPPTVMVNNFQSTDREDVKDQADSLAEGLHSLNFSTCKSQNNTDHVLSFASFKSKPIIKKWRRVELNVIEYLRSLDSALHVSDVTQANLGYDIELVHKNGKKYYIEVKSVSSFKNPFKITNNEYTSAHTYGENYYIAIVALTEKLSIKFISNPLNKLKFEKKCEQWSWYCDSYEDELVKAQTLSLLLEDK